MLSKQEEILERKRTLENDRRLREQQGSSFFHQTHIDDAGGRFAAISNPHIVGTSPVPNYPAASAPFQFDPVPNEPPLGWDNPALEPSAGLLHSPVEQLPNPASPSTPLDVEGAGLGLSQTGDPTGVDTSQPSSTFITNVNVGSSPLRRRRL
jgi:hypothetical protein